MKKIVVFASVVLLTSVLSGCNSNESELLSIEATSTSTQTFYVGEHISKSDLTVNAKYVDGSSKKLNDDEWTSPSFNTEGAYIFTKEGDNLIVVNYKEVSTTITLNAINYPTTYAVRFESNGGSTVEPQTIEKGKCATLPTAPTKEHYTFICWCKEKECVNPFEFSTTINEDITLYAKWEAVKYNVSYYDLTLKEEGGVYVKEFVKSDIPDEKVEYGKCATKPTDPSPKSEVLFKFAGWYLDEALTKQFTFDTPITSDTKLYANYSRTDQCVVYFDVDVGQSYFTIVNKGTALTRPDDPAKKGYNFDNWYTDSSYQTKYDFKEKVNNHLILYAKFNLAEYELIVDFAEDKGSIIDYDPTIKHHYNDEITLAAKPNSEVFFSGWYLDKDYANLATNDNTYKFKMPAENTHLYVRFTAQKDWDKDHGLIPQISEDKKTLTYGIYPKNYVKDPESALLEASAKQEYDKPFLYKNDYYVKNIAKPYKQLDTEHPITKFHDGAKVREGYEYIFKCEPIYWNVISSENDIYTVIAKQPIDSSMFDLTTNVYKDSYIRNYVNNVLINIIFKDKSYIVPTDLDDVGLKGELMYLATSKDVDPQTYKPVIGTDYGYSNTLRYSLVLTNQAFCWSRTAYEEDNWVHTNFLPNPPQLIFNGILPKLRVKIA